LAEGESEETTRMADKLNKPQEAENENALLLENGFESVGSNDLLWVKESVCYGREAALQVAAGDKWRQKGLEPPLP
jgi:hypothetical protein